MTAILASADGVEVAGVCTSLAEARNALRDKPDVVMLDLGLPDGDGIDLIREIRSEPSTVKILVVTLFADEDRVIRAIEAGADGYVLKGSAEEDFRLFVRQTYDGEAPISARAAAHLLRRVRRPQVSAGRSGKPVELSPRETELLEMLARGVSYKEAARRLGLSPHTVAEYVGTIYRKLSVKSKAEAVYEAMQSGLLKQPD